MIAHVWLIPALPLLAAILVSAGGRRSARLAGSITAGAVFFSLIMALNVLTGLISAPGVEQVSMVWLRSAGNLSMELGMLVDPLSVIMLVIVCFISLMVQIYSLGYMAGDQGIVRYFSFMSFFTFSMLGLVLANNLITLYMFWELVGLSSYLLIGFWYHKPEAADAAKKAFIVTRFGDLGLLIGILVLAYFLNTFNILEVGEAVKGGQLTGHWSTMVALLIFAGAAGKSAQFPLHVWLPDAMEGPTPVSALIHAATMVAAGVFLVARLFPVFAASETALMIIAYLGGFTALLAATIACVQNDIKRILAYSTVSQLGYMMMALGCRDYIAGMFHLTTHAVFKALLFLAAGSVIHAVHTNDIRQMGGLGPALKITAATMLVAALALGGIPPFSGFFSKDAILMGIWAAGRMDLLMVGIVTAGLTTFYIFRLWLVVFTGRPAEKKYQAHESPWVMILPLLVLALLALSLGWLGENFRHFLSASWGAPSVGEAPHHRLIPMFALLASLAGFGWAYLVYFQKTISAALLARKFAATYKLLKHKYYIDEIYIFLVRQGMFMLSRGLAWFDRYVVDGMVNRIGEFCRLAGKGTRRLQVGRLQAYLLAFFLGLVVIMVSVLMTHPEILEIIRSYVCPATGRVVAML